MDVVSTLVVKDQLKDTSQNHVYSIAVIDEGYLKVVERKSYGNLNLKQSFTSFYYIVIFKS